MRAKDFFRLFLDAFTEWNEDRGTRLGAAVAYFTIFSFAPLLVVVIAVAGSVLGEKAVRGDVVGQIAGLVGLNTAELIQTMIVESSKPKTGLVATVIGVITLLLGTTGLFAELHDDLNIIWKITAKPRGIVATIRDRFIAFLVVLGIAFLLLVSLVVSAGVVAVGRALGSDLPTLAFVLQMSNFVISLGVGTILFAIIYKVLPDAEIAWRDVWVGAGVTSFLFTIGQFLIGLYVGYSGAASAYGAAGSLVILLLWVFYSAQILFFGAEFTQVYANRYGQHVRPTGNATLVARSSVRPT